MVVQEKRPLNRCLSLYLSCVARQKYCWGVFWGPKHGPGELERCVYVKLQLHHCPHEGCDYACPSKNGMSLHLLKHAQPNAFACEVCGKTFKRQTYVVFVH